MWTTELQLNKEKMMIVTMPVRFLQISVLVVVYHSLVVLSLFVIGRATLTLTKRDLSLHRN